MKNVSEKKSETPILGSITFFLNDAIYKRNRKILDSRTGDR